MNRSLQIRAGLTVVILLLSIYGLLPTFKALSISPAEREAAKADPVRLAEIQKIDAQAIRRGLDLKGGMYLVLEVDQTGMNAGEAQDALMRVKEILYNRIDKFGVSEPEITTFGSSRIVVKLPGLQDPERAKNLLGTTAQLEFRMVRPSDDIQDALERMDQLFMGEVVGAAVAEGEDVAAEAPAAEAPADEAAADEVAADETATAEEDSAADPFAELDDLLADAGDADALDSEFLKEHPFSGLLVMAPGTYASTPLFVSEENVDRVQAMLDDERVPARLRGVEFQLDMDPVNMGQGQMLRPL